MKTFLTGSVALVVVGLGLSIVARAEDTVASVKYDMAEDIVYGNKDGMGLTLDVLTPEGGGKHIGVILVSSGSWKSNKSNVPDQEAKRLQDHWVQGLLQGGYTIFLTRHGSAPRYFVPEMIEDIRRSVRFVRLHAQRFHVDPQHLGITSGSSGGHLALMVATTGDDGQGDASDPVERVSSRVQAVVAWFPPTDLVNWGMPDGYRTVEKLRPGFFENIFGKITDLESQLKSISPIYQVSKDDPPLLLIHGDRDVTVPVQQSRILKEKYDELGLGVQLIVHPGGGHTYWRGILNEYPAVWAWFDRYLAAN
jgi:acetyl esterase/lipase